MDIIGGRPLRIFPTSHPILLGMQTFFLALQDRSIHCWSKGKTPRTQLWKIIFRLGSWEIWDSGVHLKLLRTAHL
jgi:hypothetical protein